MPLTSTKTIKIVSLLCNILLNAMVRCSVLLHADRYVLFICSFSTIEIVIVDYIGDVEIRECHQQGVDGG